MTAEWQGPFFVTRKLENNNFEIDLGRRKATLHLNSLKRYYPRVNDDTAINQSLVINRTNGDRDDVDAGMELDREDETDTTGAIDEDDIVTKVTFHLPPTATHLLGEWTLPSHALVLCSSEALHLFQ